MTSNPNFKPRVAIETLGCKLNQSESEQLARNLIDKGYRMVLPEDGYDIYVLNTCTVTHIADRKARHLLRMARRQIPDAYVIATGCLAERDAALINLLNSVDLVVGNTGKEDIPTRIEEWLKGRNLNHNRLPAPASRWGRTRAMVKIQAGCSQSCTYCIVPMVRGKSKSIDPAIVLHQAGNLVHQGYKEIVLTGSNIGSYKHDGTGLAHLVKMILSKTPVERLRLSSLQAQEITPELVTLWQNPRLCRHVHLPLQSGSDAVLQRMKRRYNVNDFRIAVSLLRDSIPDIGITTDVIVGFPSETDAEFSETESLCKDISFARMHLFPYSPRPGTAAASLSHRVDPKLVKTRLVKMQEIARQSSQKFRGQFVGKVLPVLWERPLKGTNDLWSGLTDNYIRVCTTTSGSLRNEIIHTRLTRIEEGNVFGDIIEP